VTRVPLGGQAFAPTRRELQRVYEKLLAAYGPQHWWPADSPFEVMVGAVLTQNTAWRNVERAIANLDAAQALTPSAIAHLPPAELAALIRPAGYFNVKARRLQALCRFVLEAGGEDALAQQPTVELRHALLAVHGVGAETADDILLYAFGRPVFVIDTYTRRLLRRLGLAGGDEGYEELRLGIEQALGLQAQRFNELHGLIVHHAKVACGAKPRCTGCCLRRICPEGRAAPMDASG
jgi:endonuclease-3 related protein